MKKIGIALALVVLALIVGGTWYVTQRREAPVAEGAPTVARWTCPMHPQVISDHPGECPICHMTLVPVEAERAEEHADHEGADHVPVRLSEAKIRRIGARSVAAEIAPFRREIRAVATITVDETRIRQVNAKTAGYVERLWADAVGETVRAGAPLLEIYSPELLAAQQEYLVAARADPSVAASVVPAARRRLELLDMSGDQIDALERTGDAKRTVTLRSPISGTILERAVAQGARIEPGMEVVKVADLSRVWAIASVYEYELPYVKVGDEAVTTLSYFPGKEFPGRISFVYPTVDPQTRTAQVRIELPNSDGALKPGMFAEARIVADLGERLSVPTESVMDTGTRKLVFVDAGDGAFDPREIETGLRLPDRVEVLSGLRAGEKVLSEGNFFIDAESRIRAGLK